MRASPFVRSDGAIATVVGVLLLSGTTMMTEAFAPTPVISPLSQMGRTVVNPQQQTARHMVMDNVDPLGLMASTTNFPTKAETRTSTDPTPVLLSFFENMDISIGNNVSMKAATAAAVMAMALALLPFDADAAMSGGRMGGSYARPMQTRSMPRSSSYGRGGYSSGYSSYSRRSTTIVSPTVVTPGYGFGYNPFFPGVYGGGYYGGGAMAVGWGGPSLFDILLLGGLLYAATNFFRGSTESSSVMDWVDSDTVTALGSGTSVVQLSVAMEVPNRDDPNSILSVLNRLSQTSKTDSRVGIQNLTSQVALELLRKKSSIVSASSNYQHFGNRAKADRHYQNLSIQERGKFEQETVSRYGGVNYNSDNSRYGDKANPESGQATMAVITLVLAIDGDTTKISSSMNSMSDVENALRRIAADAKVDDCLQSVEILWTPEDRNEILTARDVVADYPELRAV